MALSWGPFTIPVSWLGLLTGAIGYYLWMRWTVKGKERQTTKQFFDDLLSAVLVGFVVYKLWPLVEETDTFLHNPAALLLYSGGAYAVEAALVAAIGWFIYRTRKERWRGWQTTEWMLAGVIWLIMADALMVREYGAVVDWGWSVGEITYAPLNLIDLVLTGCLAVVVHVLPKKVWSERDRVGMILIGLGLVRLVRSLWSPPAADAILWGLSLGDLLFLLGLFVGMGLFLFPQRS